MVLYMYMKDGFQLFHVTVFFYELVVGFYNVAMEGSFLLLLVDLRSLQLLLICLSGITMFTLNLNFLHFATKCGFRFFQFRFPFSLFLF